MKYNLQQISYKCILLITTALISALATLYLTNVYVKYSYSFNHRMSRHISYIADPGCF